MQSGRVVRMIAAGEGISMTSLAGKLGISRQALYGRLNGEMKFSSFMECLEAMGYSLYYGKDGRVKKIDY